MPGLIVFAGKNKRRNEKWADLLDNSELWLLLSLSGAVL